LAPVRVNLIAAGFVDTELSASLLEDQLENRRNQLRATLPIRRDVGRADVAALAVQHHDQHGAHGHDPRHRRWAAVGRRPEQFANWCSSLSSPAYHEGAKNTNAIANSRRGGARAI